MKSMEQLTKTAMSELSNQSEGQPQSEVFNQDKVNTYECTGCQKVWKVPTKSFMDGNYSAECHECALKRRLEKFALICPRLYQDSEVARLPPRQMQQAMEWKIGTRGLLFLGDTGKGKTRVAWMVIKEALTKGKKDVSFRWFDCVGFGHELAKHYKAEDAEEWLERTTSVDLLFFDDLGKLKMTERAEVELFGMIERRFAAQLPIIVTTNDTGDTLAARMTDNRGPALIRRLREFCDPIQF